ncbi:hypothetical protein LCGC14_0784170 [marine sediment metagenome]|uniref:Uncharacterized protein n=1 Tax=marine sediment metagenome TaxID=412755 RepID=A0A0F9PUU6_9ZZZZ
MNKKYIIILLILIIILLAGILVFTFGVSKYQEKVYDECITDITNIIVGSIQTRGYVDILVNNQTIILVPWKQ